ncbi:MAG: c-type cytochrome [Thiobacillaceae bacterium]
MADNAKMTQATPQEIIISVVAGLFAPLIAIFLIVQLVAGIQEKHVNAETPEAAAKTVENNIKPFATLQVADANAPKVDKSGQEVFDAVCTACHSSGALGAPKFRNKVDWAPRIAEGLDILTKHALEGIRQMPARGGNPDLSDTEVIRAIVYMANAAGAKFKEPATAAPAAAPAASGAAPAGAGTAAAVAAASPARGKAVFEATCIACHGTGVLGAPKFGDKAAWAPRIKTGMDSLYHSALTGKNAMPARGGNASLSDADVKAAVNYMVSKAK